MKEIVKGIWTWSALSEEKGYNFNGTLVQGENAQVLIDPVRLPEKEYKELKARGPFEAIYLSNKDHERMAYDLRRDLSVPIWIHEEDAPLLKEKPDHTFREGDKLACDIEVLHLPDQKSRGESAFYLRERGVIILGDALLGVPAGQLSLLPAAKYKDVEKARLGLARLRALYFEAILTGDGEPVLVRAHDILEQFFLRLIF
ncbi:MAG: hypothetical protein Q8R76_11495 [Candidatus Omnitrophota bacterium]|nr:hypothetical protein [Candidatus Omnitrophota bacterium]